MRRNEHIDGRKRCSSCKEYKEIDNFGAHKGSWDGLHPTCKTCRKEDRKLRYAKQMADPDIRLRIEGDRLQWQHNNKEMVNSYNRRAYQKFRPQRIKRVVEWGRKNRDRYNARQRMARERNPEQYRMYEQKKYERHGETIKAAARNRSARVRGAEGKCSLKEWKAIIEIQNGRCNGCGAECELTMDHIIPIIAGGSNWSHNIQGLCFKCNSKKGRKTMEEFLRLNPQLVRI